MMKTRRLPRCRSMALWLPPVLLLVVLGGCSRDNDTNPPIGIPDEGQSELPPGETPPAAGSPATKESRPGDEGSSAGVIQTPPIDKATATIGPASGSTVTGTVTFLPAEDGRSMMIKVDISGLDPGEHGFHIHEVGDCSAPDATSAGGHFNPDDSHHGGPHTAESHLGDLGNIRAGDDGRAEMRIRSAQLKLTGPTSILEKAVVVHAGEDDLETDPSGNSGARVGCGVIHGEGVNRAVTTPEPG